MKKSNSHNNSHKRNRDKQGAKFIMDALNQDDPILPGEKKTAKERAEEARKMARQKLEEQAFDENQMELEVDEDDSAHRERMEPLELNLPNGKKFFRIGEAADAIGVEPYVLRYWESEFSVIRPNKTRSGHRIYTRRDVINFKNIRNLLYSEGFSVKQARKELQLRKKQQKLAADATSDVEIHYRARLKDLASELRQLIQTAKQTPWTV